jgi:diacylglycerol kinase (ATP)
MKSTRRFTLLARLGSIHHAARGIRLMLVGEHNAWVHAAVSVVVLIAAVIFHLTRNEWCAVVLAMMAVWTAEALNTAFEFLCDVASPGLHPQVERAKDVAAGGVLISAAGSVVVGLLVFIPHLLALWSPAR